MTDHARLAAILRADPTLMRVLTGARALALPDWLVFSGAVYQAVWNDLTGRPPGYGVKDFDLGYFDPDTSYVAEDRIIQRVAAAFDEPLKTRVEVRNQARVPIWFPEKFGEPYPSIACTADALRHFVAPCFAVGVRLEADDRLFVEAPFGLDDLFALVVRPNPYRPRAKDWDAIVQRLQSRWPDVKVVHDA